MRFMVGYSVWFKVDMLTWLIEGIVQNFSPQNTEIAFHFDACTDGCAEAFDSLVPYWFMIRGKWKEQYIHKLVSTKEVREVGGHNRLIDQFMASDCDFLIVAQDDQRFNQSPVEHLIKLHDRYGKRLGVIGGRDGYRWGYEELTGSNWSESAVRRRLAPGEWFEVPYQNSGPNIYNRHLIERVGKLDEEFVAYYVWDDYGARATNLGFVNGVLGTDITHAKFGRVKPTEFTPSSARDLARLKALHGLSL